MLPSSDALSYYNRTHILPMLVICFQVVGHYSMWSQEAGIVNCLF